MESPWKQTHDTNPEQWKTELNDNLDITLTINRDTGLCEALLTDKTADGSHNVHAVTFRPPGGTDVNAPCTAQRLAALLLVAWAAKEARRMAGYVDALIPISPTGPAPDVWYTPQGFDPSRHARRLSADREITLERRPGERMANDSWVLTVNGEDMGCFSAPTADAARAIADQILVTMGTGKE